MGLFIKGVVSGTALGGMAGGVIGECRDLIAVRNGALIGGLYGAAMGSTAEVLITVLESSCLTDDKIHWDKVEREAV